MNQKIDLSKQDISFLKLLRHIQKTFPKLPGIYSITNTKNKKRYIGYTANLNSRLRNHLFQLQRKTHSNFRLQKAWNHYEGTKTFTIEILQTFRFYPQACQSTFRRITNYLPQTLLERRWIEYYKTYIFRYGYNCNIYEGRKGSKNLPC